MNKQFKGGRRIIACLAATATVLAGSLGVTPISDVTTAKAASANTISHVSVHDPSVVKGDNGYYYIFGSHRAFAKSKDLSSWSTFTNNINTDYKNIFKVGAAWSATGDSSYDLSGNVWHRTLFTTKRWVNGVCI